MVAYENGHYVHKILAYNKQILCEKRCRTDLTQKVFISLPCYLLRWNMIIMITITCMFLFLGRTPAMGSTMHCLIQGKS